jgi:replicative DNA helicase
MTTFQVPSTPADRVSSLLRQMREGSLKASGVAPAATGFEPFDSVLDGGFLPGEVILLGGQPGAGKTICALQWARNLCASGRRVTFACFEHDEATLLNRLLIMEMAGVAINATPTDRIQARTAIRDMMLGLVGMHEALAASPLVDKTLATIEQYASRLQMLRASTQRTTPDELELVSLPHLEPGSVLFVDYLQKLPVPQASGVEEQVYRAVEILKEMAMAHQISVVALSAADSSGIGADRLRLEHLRGSDALAHECDVAVLMNQKVTATSDRHLKYDLTRLDDARRRTIFSIEKNRRGEVDVHLEFEKDFANFRFNPRGAFISDALAGD